MSHAFLTVHFLAPSRVLSPENTRRPSLSRIRHVSLAVTGCTSSMLEMRAAERGRPSAIRPMTRERTVVFSISYVPFKLSARTGETAVDRPEMGFHRVPATAGFSVAGAQAVHITGIVFAPDALGVAA